MRRSLRFFRSFQFFSHRPQDRPFQQVQIVKTITAGLAHGAQQRFPWILPHQTQQSAAGQA